MKKLLYTSIISMIALNTAFAVTPTNTTTQEQQQDQQHQQEQLKILQQAKPQTPAGIKMRAKKSPLTSLINNRVETDELLKRMKKNIINQLDKKLENNPHNLWAIIQKGWALNSEGKYDEAIKYFNRAIKLQKASAAYMGLGMAYIRKGELKKANAYYMLAMEQDEKADPYYIEDTKIPDASVQVSPDADTMN